MATQAQIKTATDAFRKAYAANKRYTHAEQRCSWLSAHKGPDPFVIHHDALQSMKAECASETRKFTASATCLTTEEILAICKANME